jgi:hypothetical protein
LEIINNNYMKTFEELKEELLNRAKNANACQNGYKMGLDAKNKADLLKAITANWFWVLIDARIVDAIYLEENFTEEELSEAGIYTRKCHEVRTVSFACGSATVKAYDSATVKACDSATVEAYDSATVKAYDSATVEAYDSATVEAYDSATVKAYGSATVKAYDSATVKAYGDSYVEDRTDNIRPGSDYAIVKDYYNHKIYIRKGKFEIIEV